LNSQAIFYLKLSKLEGKVVQPKHEVIEIGWIAVEEAPEGNLFTLIKLIQV